MYQQYKYSVVEAHSSLSLSRSAEGLRWSNSSRSSLLSPLPPSSPQPPSPLLLRPPPSLPPCLTTPPVHVLVGATLQEAKEEKLSCCQYVDLLKIWKTRTVLHGFDIRNTLFILRAERPSCRLPAV